MRTWKRISKVKSSGAIVLAALVALATVSPGGAFTSNAAGESASDAFGYSFDAFVSALADDAVETEAPAEDTGSGSSSAEVSVETDEATPEKDASVEAQADPAPVVEQVTNDFADIDVSDTPPADLSDVAAQAAAQEQQLEQADTEDVIAALLALLNSAEPQVLAGIDAAEAAVLAKVDKAKADTIVAFQQTELPEEAAILAAIDNARLQVVQAFAMMRAKVVQAFADSRTTVIEELTGVDFGDGADEVLAKIAEIQQFVNNVLAGVQAILTNLGGTP
jgi:hypothetical protein